MVFTLTNAKKVPFFAEWLIVEGNVAENVLKNIIDKAPELKNLVQDIINLSGEYEIIMKLVK